MLDKIRDKFDGDRKVRIVCYPSRMGSHYGYQVVDAETGKHCFLAPFMFASEDDCLEHAKSYLNLV